MGDSLFIRMCASKRVYRTEKYALGVAKRCEERRGVKLRAYSCPYCGNWHVTKAPPQESRPDAP